MLPVGTLIILTTAYSLNGIRKINFELSKLEFTSSGDSLNEKKPHGCILDGEIGGLRDCKGCLKALCVLQTGFGVVWFVTVLALENVDYSSGMAVVYLIVSFVLVSDIHCCNTATDYVVLQNWSVCFKSRVFLPMLCGIQNDEIVVEEQQKTINNSTASRDSSDSIPLLIGVENCTEMRELRHEHISTISG